MRKVSCDYVVGRFGGIGFKGIIIVATTGMAYAPFSFPSLCAVL